MNRLKIWLVILLSLCLGLFAVQYNEKQNIQNASPKQANNPVRPEFKNIDISGKVNAPDLVGGKDWLNVNQPLSLKQLRGKVVLLDFWTYCCINCMHVIPDLKKLEKKYAEELVVIGVHSAKFTNEKESENIRNAILRYEIEHPVVNDADFKIWTRYGARGWPHLVIIDPEGKVVGSLSGEGNYEVLDYIIGALIQKFEDRINRKLIPLALEKDKLPMSVLSFPGKIIAEEKSQRLFISDSNHNRILVTDFVGNVLDIAGNGSIGMTDGKFQEAEFNHPQGMTISGNSLYVADTENHAIRRLDLEKRTVITVAGIGQQSRTRNGGPALKTALNSPWDLTRIGNEETIYIAMAGPHQLWTYNPLDETVQPFAGSGREDIIDGLLKQSALAQPSGICSDGTNLYFADSEVSALRWVDLSDGKREVKTFIGTGLFDFGDRDGDFKQALLQHPLGVDYQDGKIYIADAYNHKIKVADVESRTITTLAGTGKPGIGTKKKPQFNEPAGVSIAKNRLFVADTNNHAIRIIDLPSREVTSLIIDLSEWHRKSRVDTFDLFGNPKTLSLSEKKIASDGKVELTFDLPPHYHLNPLAAPIVQLKVHSPNHEAWISPKIKPSVQGDTIEFPVETGNISAPERVEISVTYYYCRTDNQGQCNIGSLLIDSPLESGDKTVRLNHSLENESHSP